MAKLLDIAARLAPQRRALGMSQRELAEKIGSSQQQVARWEAFAYRTASLERVAAVADALGVACPDLPSAAEAPALYSIAPTAPGTSAVTPVRDLGQVAARLRASAATLRDTYKFDRIGVFGSFATGDQTPDSDIDLLVETEDPGGIRFVEAALLLEGILGRSVDLIRPESLRDPIRKRVMKEVLYVWSAGSDPAHR